MAKKTFTGKFQTATVLCLTLALLSCQSIPANAAGWDRPGDNRHGGNFHRPEYRSYHGGSSYGSALGIFAAILTIGTIVALAPKPTASSKIVYAPYPAQTQIPSGETVTINIPNSNGSYTSVTLVKNNNGYTGPQGEYYPGRPTVEQLKALYGN
jgi:hypothetical protein